MFVVLFEVNPRPERWDDYLRYAGMLRPELEQIDGFMDNRRFRSRRHDGRLLSLSFWRDEKSVVRWRSHAMHHGVQAKGRSEVFRDYHLRVGEVMRDNGATQPQSRFDETETGVARAASIVEGPATEAPPDTAGLVDWDLFDGILDPQDRLLLLSWSDAGAMQAWVPQAGNRRRDVRIVRDYGLRDRAEAPQFHP
jgi:heme-degrading monooxygenase HmoA